MTSNKLFAALSIGTFSLVVGCAGVAEDTNGASLLAKDAAAKASKNDKIVDVAKEDVKPADADVKPTDVKPTDIKPAADDVKPAEVDPVQACIDKYLDSQLDGIKEKCAMAEKLGIQKFDVCYPELKDSVYGDGKILCTTTPPKPDTCFDDALKACNAAVAEKAKAECYSLAKESPEKYGVCVKEFSANYNCEEDAKIQCSK